jgi:hypothetical protein
LLNTVFGSGLAPPTLGWISDRMAARAFVSGDFAVVCPNGLPAPGASAQVTELCAAASATGVQQALMITVCAGFLAAAAYFASTFTLRRSLHEASAQAQP